MVHGPAAAPRQVFLVWAVDERHVDARELGRICSISYLGTMRKLPWGMRAGELIIALISCSIIKLTGRYERAGPATFLLRSHTGKEEIAPSAA